MFQNLHNRSHHCVLLCQGHRGIKRENCKLFSQQVLIRFSSDCVMLFCANEIVQTSKFVTGLYLKKITELVSILRKKLYEYLHLEIYSFVPVLVTFNIFFNVTAVSKKCNWKLYFLVEFFSSGVQGLYNCCRYGVNHEHILYVSVL